MNNLLKVLALGTIVLVVSCDKDEPKVDAIVGKWELDNAVFSNAPSAFSLQNRELPSLYGESEYTIEFFSDFFYEREAINTVFGNLDDDGEWELSEDRTELELDPDGSSPFILFSFNVEGDITDRDMILTSVVNVFAWPDTILTNQAIIDTVDTAEEVEAIDEMFGTTLQVDITLDFDRKRVRN